MTPSVLESGAAWILSVVDKDRICNLESRTEAVNPAAAGNEQCEAKYSVKIYLQ